MINKISFYGIRSIMPKKQSAQPIFKQQLPYDTIEIGENNRFNSAYNAAREKAISTLQEKGADCRIIVSPKGNTQFEYISSNSQNLKQSKIPADSSIIIGYTTHTPLTPKNVAQFLASDAKSIEVVTDNGEYSKLSKNDEDVKIKNIKNTTKELTLQLYTKAAQKAGISLKPTKSDFMELANDYLYNVVGKDCRDKSYEEILNELAVRGIKSSGDISFDYRQLNKACKDYIFYVSTTKYKRILHKENEINAFLSTPEGFNTHQEFLQNVAEKYNLTYESNMQP